MDPFNGSGSSSGSGAPSAAAVNAAEKPPGPLELQMRSKVEASLKPSYYALVNESHQHSVPKNSETHFKLLVVSEVFEGMSRLARSRFVHELFAVELQTGVHALTQKTWTPLEYEAAGNVIELESPACRGGSRSLNR